MTAQSSNRQDVEQNGIDNIDPDELMANISRSNLGKTIVISTIFHIIFIGALSIGYIGQCIKYKRLDVKVAIKQEKARKKQEEEKKRRAELIEKAKAAAKKAAKSKQAAKKQPAKAPQSVKGKKRVPKILQEINEVSKERPKETEVKSLDDDLGLDELN